MTDQDMIRLCLDAFKAISHADTAKNFLRLQDEPKNLWHGTGQQKLRGYMIRKIQDHLGIK